MSETTCELCGDATPQRRVRTAPARGWDVLCPACWMLQEPSEPRHDPGPSQDILALAPERAVSLLTHYILDGHRPVSEPDVFAWSAWMATPSRRVAHTRVPPDIQVSTIFLGLDHGVWSAVPLLFETMVFGLDAFQDVQERYPTWEEAEAGHAQVVARVQAWLALHTPVSQEGAALQATLEWDRAGTRTDGQASGLCGGLSGGLAGGALPE